LYQHCEFMSKIKVYWM